MASKLLTQVLQFAAVGGLGTVTNLIVFFLLVDLYSVTGHRAGMFVAFMIAVTQNYALNELWTFNSEGQNRIQARRFAKFAIFSAIALGVNFAVLETLISQFSFPLLVIPQAVGILAATALNFLTSRLVTFR